MTKYFHLLVNTCLFELSVFNEPQMHTRYEIGRYSLDEWNLLIYWFVKKIGACMPLSFLNFEL